VDDASPQMLWTRYFIEEQGYGVQASILNQDNLSAILLEKNGKASSGKRTKHINVRYFFIKDRIGSGEITVKHCSAAEMLADHFTKPLQGTMFRKFRAEIQGVPIGMCDADVGWDRPCAINERELCKACPSPQECVGTHEDRTSVRGRDTTAVPIVPRKDTGAVSKDTVGGGSRDRRAACSPVPALRKTYASAVRGK
jgi:hypothetical protein